MRKFLPTGLAIGAAALGTLNVVAAVELDVDDALRSPDAWLPLTAALAGWLVLRLSPRNAVGWLLLAIAWSSAIFGAAAIVVIGSPDVPAAAHDLAAWLGTWVFLPSYLFAFLVLPLLFPDGRLPSWQWRPVLVASSALVAIESFLLAFGSRSSVDADVANPWSLGAAETVLDFVEPVIWVSMPALALLGIASLVHRVVSSQGTARRAALALGVTAALGLSVLLTTGNGLVLGLLLPLVVAGAVAQQIVDQLESQLRRVTDQADELRDSRARITQAHDNARRAIERDLHDGAQQGLLAIAMDLGRFGSKLDGEARQEAERLQTIAQRTLVDLRRLAAGTYPSALRELGLGPALREAIGNDVAIHDRSGERPHEATEAALYFACLEAVTNARKHAQASTVTVTLDQLGDGAHRFAVTDDGTGIPRGTRGNGLDGMADRLRARGGRLDVSGSPGRGTTVVGVAYDAPR